MTNNSSTPQSDSGAKRIEKLPLRHLILGLFIQPQMLMIICNGRLRRALKAVFVMIFICGLVLGLAQTRGLQARARAWAEWFEQTTERFELTEDGRLQWRLPQELPATFYKGRTRVDFANETADIKKFQPKLEDDRGIWISPNSMFWWERIDEQGEPVAQAIYHEQKLMGRFSVESIWPEGFVLEDDGFEKRVSKWMLTGLLPGLVIAEILKTAGMILFYTFIFAVIPYLLRSPMAMQGFKAIYGFYLYASIPPLIVATIYSLAITKWVAFDSFFLFAFIFYLFFAMWKIRRSFQVGTRG